MTVKKEIRLIITWCVIGFVCGMTLGLFVFKGYIENYTNKCIYAFNDCKYKYNSIVETKPLQESLGYPFNLTIDFSKAEFNISGIG